jgi:hypothetical protein
MPPWQLRTLNSCRPPNERPPAHSLVEPRRPCPALPYWSPRPDGWKRKVAVATPLRGQICVASGPPSDRGTPGLQARRRHADDRRSMATVGPARRPETLRQTRHRAPTGVSARATLDRSTARPLTARPTAEGRRAGVRRHDVAVLVGAVSGRWRAVGRRGLVSWSGGEAAVEVVEEGVELGGAIAVERWTVHVARRWGSSVARRRSVGPVSEV